MCFAMDDLPNIHWRTQRNAWLKQTGTRLTIFDLFILTTCAAAGMLIARGMIGERALSQLNASPGEIVFGALLPCLVSGVMIGHPVVMTIHWLTGRRLGLTWTAGEAMGLVPCISALLLITIGLIGAALDELFGSAGPIEPLFACTLVGVLFANIVLPFFAVAYVVDRFTNARAVSWTDTLGLLAAFLPSGMVALLMTAAWLLN